MQPEEWVEPMHKPQLARTERVRSARAAGVPTCDIAYERPRCTTVRRSAIPTPYGKSADGASPTMPSAPNSRNSARHMHCVASRLAIARTAPAPSACTFFFEALSFFLFVRVASLSFSFAYRAEQRGGAPRRTNAKAELP